MDTLDQIKRDEGLNLKPYHDSRGFLTIGYGTLIENGIDMEEADWLLRHRYERRAKAALANALPWTAKLDAPRLAVLENMAYNMGIHGLLEFKNTLSLVENGHYAAASAAMLASLWAKQVGVRAQRLARQMETGVWQ
jgi:lysozyme